MFRIVASIAFTASAVLAADARAQQLITLEDVGAAVIAQNAALRAARAGEEEAAARITEGRAGFFPRISISESWQRGDQPVFVFSSLLASRRFAAANFAIDALNHPDPTGFFRTTVALDQVVFDGGRQQAASASARLDAELAALRVREVADQAGLTATQTFGRLLSAQAGRDAAQSGLDSAQQDVAAAERRRDAGMATESDVLALAVHAADLRQRVIQADGEAAVARAELNRLMGAPIDRDLRAVEPRINALPALASSSIATLLAEADAARPEIQRAMRAEQLAELASDQARAALIPQLAAHAALDFSGTTFGDRASAWIVGAEVRWTFATGGAEVARLEAARAAVARSRAERDDVRSLIHVDVISAVRLLEVAAARAAAGRLAVDQARESERIIRNRLEAGLATTSDLLRAAAAVLDADTNRIAAVVAMVTAAAQLRRAIGRDLPHERLP